MGGSEETIKGEFRRNGITNNLKHERGVLSMARSNDMDSASSQFFIVQKTYPSLDGSYAAFGRVLEGLNVVDEIAEVETDSNDKPKEEIKMRSIRFIVNSFFTATHTCSRRVTCLNHKVINNTMKY